MLEFAEGAFKLTNAYWFLILALSCSGYTILWQMMDSHLPAAAGFPMMVVGAAFGQHAMTTFGWQLSEDKIVNAAIGMGGGMFIATFLLLSMLWMTYFVQSR